MLRLKVTVILEVAVILELVAPSSVLIGWLSCAVLLYSFPIGNNTSHHQADPDQGRLGEPLLLFLLVLTVKTFFSSTWWWVLGRRRAMRFGLVSLVCTLIVFFDSN